MSKVEIVRSRGVRRFQYALAWVWVVLAASRLGLAIASGEWLDNSAWIIVDLAMASLLGAQLSKESDLLRLYGLDNKFKNPLYLASNTDN